MCIFINTIILYILLFFLQEKIKSDTYIVSIILEICIKSLTSHIDKLNDNVYIGNCAGKIHGTTRESNVFFSCYIHDECVYVELENLKLRTCLRYMWNAGHVNFFFFFFSIKFANNYGNCQLLIFSSSKFKDEKSEISRRMKAA